MTGKNHLLSGRYALIALIYLCVLLPVLVAEGGQDEWLQGNRIKVRPGGFEGQSLMTMEIGQHGDVLVRQETKEHDTVSTVTLLLVEGKAVAVAGGELPGGGELDILDSAGLQVQLIEHILSRAYPNGPSGVKDRGKIAIKEQKDPIRIGTTGAKGYFSPPWSVAGEAKVLAPDKIGFDFTFSFRPDASKKKTETLKFAGIWQRDPQSPHFDNRLPLQGWKIYLLGARTGEKGASYSAVPTQNYTTLGALRQALQEQR